MSIELHPRPRYIPPPPPPPPRSPSSSSWEEGSVDSATGPKSWDAPVDGLLSYVLTGRLQGDQSDWLREVGVELTWLPLQWQNKCLPKPFVNLVGHPVYCVCKVKIHSQLLLNLSFLSLKAFISTNGCQMRLRVRCTTRKK